MIVIIVMTIFSIATGNMIAGWLLPDGTDPWLRFATATAIGAVILTALYALLSRLPEAPAGDPDAPAADDGPGA